MFWKSYVALEDAGVKTIGVTNECTGRNGTSQPLVTLDEKCDAIVSCGNVSELIELPPMETVLGELQSLARDGLSGGWAGDVPLRPVHSLVTPIVLTPASSSATRHPTKSASGLP